MNIQPINNTQTNFKGGINLSKAKKAISQGYDKVVVDNLAKGIGKVTSLKTTDKVFDVMNNWKSPYQRLCDIGSVVLTAFTVKDTIKSKKIDEDRKPFMIVNNVLVTAVSSTLAALIDRVTFKPQNDIANAFVQKNKAEITEKTIKEFIDDPKNAEFVKMKDLKKLSEESFEKAQKVLLYRNKDKFMTGLGKLKSVFIFTSIVRFVVPIAFVPITAKIIDKLEARTKAKKASQDGAQTKAAPLTQPAVQTPVQPIVQPVVQTVVQAQPVATTPNLTPAQNPIQKLQQTQIQK